MGLFSVTHTGRVRTWQGLLADFIADGRTWGTNDLLAPTDLPGTFYLGNGVNTFVGLSALGKTKRPVAAAINTTAAGTSDAVLAGIAAGLITSTSAAAVTLTLPTATVLAGQFKGQRGVSVEFTVDNSVGANTVTVAVNTGITVGTAVITGSDTLAVAAGKVGVFRIYFLTATTALLSRLL